MINQEWWRNCDESTSFQDELNYFMSKKRKRHINKTVRKNEYLNYLSSPEWMNIKARIKQNRKQCESCGSMDNLEVHHRKYNANFRIVKDDDLILLCSNCHIEQHKSGSL